MTRPWRVLILTGDIGAGHYLPAALLADAIREHVPDAHVVITEWPPLYVLLRYT